MTWADALKVGLTTLAALGGSGTLILLFSGWLGKVWANRILENEKAQHQHNLKLLERETNQLLEQDRARFQRELQEISLRAAQDLHKTKERSDAVLKSLESELTKKRYVHTLQFDREFTNYTKTWATLRELSAKTLALRPIYEVHDPNESEDERKRRRSSEFIKAYSAFATHVEAEKPFFPKSIYAKLRELINIVRKEALSHKKGEGEGPGFNLNYWDEAEKNQQLITDKVDEICEAIRARIGLIEPASPREDI